VVISIESKWPMADLVDILIEYNGLRQILLGQHHSPFPAETVSDGTEGGHSFGPEGGHDLVDGRSSHFRSVSSCPWFPVKRGLGC
jgi:hypothetical protein